MSCRTAGPFARARRANAHARWVHETQGFDALMRRDRFITRDCERYFPRTYCRKGF